MVEPEPEPFVLLELLPPLVFVRTLPSLYLVFVSCPLADSLLIFSLLPCVAPDVVPLLVPEPEVASMLLPDVVDPLVVLPEVVLSVAAFVSVVPLPVEFVVTPLPTDVPVPLPVPVFVLVPTPAPFVVPLPLLIPEVPVPVPEELLLFQVPLLVPFVVPLCMDESELMLFIEPVPDAFVPVLPGRVVSEPMVLLLPDVEFIDPVEPEPLVVPEPYVLFDELVVPNPVVSVLLVVPWLLFVVFMLLDELELPEFPEPVWVVVELVFVVLRLVVLLLLLPLPVVLLCACVVPTMPARTIARKIVFFILIYFIKKLLLYGYRQKHCQL